METQMPKEIAEAVIRMMEEVGYIQKTGENKFHGYKYASIEKVLEKVQPALTKVGLVITQDETGHAIVAEGQLMEATYAFALTHKSGVQSTPVRHTGLASLRNTKGGYDDKALNKCHTAARKYFILGLFQIPTGLAVDPDDDEDRPGANGHAAHHVEIEQRPSSASMQGRKNEAEGIKKAREWVNAEAIPFVNKAKKLAEVTTFVEAHAKQIGWLKEALPEEWEALTARIDKRSMDLNPANA